MISTSWWMSRARLVLRIESGRPRKSSTQRTTCLLARPPDGIFVAPFEQGEIGPNLFWAACNVGLEGLVSKRRHRPYHSGRSPDWIKVKNRKHPAMERARESFQ